MNLPTSARPVPPWASRRLAEKFEAKERQRESERFWQALQAGRQPENRR